MIEITNEDNMDLMKRYPDNYFDLAIVDPPYGIGASSSFAGEKRKSGKGAALKSKFVKKDWDSEIPTKEYFNELRRVSKNQIIWGANYMVEHLPNSQGWIIWDKINGTTKFADAELAYTSFDRATRIFSYMWNGMLQGDMKNKEKRVHPTQKPVKLYEWVLSNYAEPNYKILDTHLGSGSIAIAVDNMNKIEKMNLTFNGCELDEEYFKTAKLRIEEQTSWQCLF